MTAIRLLVWYEVFMVLFTLVGVAVFVAWADRSFDDEVLDWWYCKLRFAGLHKAKSGLKGWMELVGGTIRYLLFWPVLIIFRLNAMVDDLVAFAEDLQNEEE